MTKLARNSPKENSGASGGFLPKPLLFHLRHPNSKKISRVFCEILSPKNSFRKTESALLRHLPEYLEGRTPKKNVLSFLEEISPPPNQKCKECFFFRGCWRTRQGVGLVFIRSVSARKKFAQMLELEHRRGLEHYMFGTGCRYFCKVADNPFKPSRE